MTEPADFFDGLAASARAGGSPILEAVHALLAAQKSGENLRVVELGEHFCTLVGSAGRPVRLFLAPESELGQTALIEELLAQNGKEGTEVVLLGGDERTAENVNRAAPKMPRYPFVVLHRTASGAVRGWPENAARKSVRTEALKQARRLSAAEVRHVLQTVDSHAETFQREQRERVQFFRGMSKKAPSATYGILGLIGAMYLLQLLWAPKEGGMAEDLFLISMGALFARLVEAGEWWRTISVGFLHANLMHVGVNSFVLYLLGGQVERVLGTARFLTLYVVALLGGSLASLQFGHGFSVGASGAVWGLLGAQVCLAYGRPPVLPRSVADSMKPLAKQNILLNVGISFLPGIDAAAHFGGGIAGAALLYSGVLYAGSGDRQAEPTDTKLAEPLWVKPLAAVCALLLVTGIGIALFHGRPWEDTSELAATLRALGAFGP